MAGNLSQWSSTASSSACSPPSSPARRSRRGSPFGAVCRFAGTTAFLGYTLALWQMSIGTGGRGDDAEVDVRRPDFALVTCAVFTWMWPH